jgi:hypothetical protein
MGDIERLISQRTADQDVFRRMVESPTQFSVGDKVIKFGGDTAFCGEVKAIYPITSVATGAAWRMDVMSIVPGADGLLHIYRPDQFRLMTDEELGKIGRMRAIWEGDDEICALRARAEEADAQNKLLRHIGVELVELFERFPNVKTVQHMREAVDRLLKTQGESLHRAEAAEADNERLRRQHVDKATAWDAATAIPPKAGRELADAQAQVAALREAIQPFATFSVGRVYELGWIGEVGRERIQAWFGPTDFRAARSAINNTARAGTDHDRRVLERAAKVCRDRVEALLRDEATQEPDTGEVNMPEWVATAIEELEMAATAIVACGERG